MAADALTTTDVAAGPAGSGGAAGRPYAPSWVDIITRWLEGLPGPTWAAYVVLAAAGVAAGLIEPLIDGAADPVTVATSVFWGITLPFTLWLIHALAGVAGDAFDTFRPALTRPEDEAARLRYELTVVPARPAWLVLLAVALTTPLYYILEPAGSGIVGYSPVGLLLRYASEVFFGALIFTLLLQSIRQLRAVGRIHESATRVDLFRPAPVYAFSILTSRTAMVIALVFVVPTLVSVAPNPAALDALGIVAPWVALGLVAAAIVFLLPLRGMQRRIVAEKRRLQTEVGARIEATLAAMHERIDAGDIPGASAQHEVLQALAMERDLVDKLPTLPWRPGTLGAVISAVVTPIGIFVLTRLLERVI